MSYSYIKSVFPNFENSNKVYDESLYNNLQPPHLKHQKEKAHDDVKIENAVVVPSPQKLLPSLSLEPVKVEKFENEIDYASSQFPKNPEQNNLKFYNQPILSDFYVKKPVETYNVKGGYQPYTGTSQSILPSYAETHPQHITIPVHTVERFEEKGCTDAECNMYVNHIVQCSKCKAVVMKRLGLDSDKFMNEEIMEILSYLIFGLFVLLLIDSLKKKND